MRIHPRIDQINIWWDEVQDEVEVYLVQGKSKAIVDSGPANADPNVLYPSLAAQNLISNDIEFILNTHWHKDHVGGNAAIKAISDAHIMMHKDDARLYEDQLYAFNQYRKPFLAALRDEKTLEREQNLLLKGEYSKINVDRKLNDGDLIDLGGDVVLSVIHLPGHTPGSIGFFWEKEGFLFSGDSVSGVHSSEGSLPIITDFLAYQSSIERLLQMPLQHLLCAHGYRGLNSPRKSIRHQDEIRQFLIDSQETVKMIIQAMKQFASVSNKRPLTDITEKVIAALPRSMGFKSLSELDSPLHSAITVFNCIHQLDAL